MTLECFPDESSGSMSLRGQIPLVEWHELHRSVTERVLQATAAAIAERFLADHCQEVLEMLKPEAVANLAVAAAAGAIREALHKNLPDKIVEVVRTEREVYQRGIFGGLARIR